GVEASGTRRSGTGGSLSSSAAASAGKRPRTKSPTSMSSSERVEEITYWSSARSSSPAVWERRAAAAPRGRRPTSRGAGGAGGGGDLGIRPGGRGDLPILYRAEHRQVAVPVEEAGAAEQLPEGDAEGEEVGTGVDRLAAGLLRCHVGELSLQHPRGAGPVAGLGDAEVGELHRPVVGDEDVVGGDVTVHQPQRLSMVGEPVGVGQA